MGRTDSPIAADHADHADQADDRPGQPTGPSDRITGRPDRPADPGHPGLHTERRIDPKHQGPVVELPDDEDVATRCPYCGRPFPRERLRTLHVGEVHADPSSEAERDAYETAREDESGDLFVYHVKVVFALSIIYTVFVLAYMVVLTLGG